MFPELIVTASGVVTTILLQLKQVIMEAALGCSFHNKSFTQLLASNMQRLEAQQHTSPVIGDGVIVDDDADSNTLHPFNVSREFLA